MSVTTIRLPKAKPEPAAKCGLVHRRMADNGEGVLTVRCDLPADHVPPTEHAALVRWSS